MVKLLQGAHSDRTKKKAIVVQTAENCNDGYDRKLSKHTVCVYC